MRDPFPGNIIPASRLNSNAVKLMDLYPAPTSGALNSNFFANRNNSDDGNAFDVRIDHNFSGRDQLFGRYSLANITRVRPSPFEGIADGGGFLSRFAQRESLICCVG